MKGTVVTGLVVVGILMGAGAGYLFGGSESSGQTLTTTTTRTITMTSSNGSTATVTTSYPNLGSLIQLRIILNASTVRLGSAIKAQVSLSNPLGTNLTAVVPEISNSTISSWNWDDFLCGDGTLNDVVAFAVFQGHYVAENLSLAGQPLSLAPPLHPPCAVWPTPIFFVYLPNSSNAWAYIGYPNPPPTTIDTIVNATTELCTVNGSGGTNCGPGSGLFGYWGGGGGPNDNYTTSSPYFHYFTPGEYTIAAIDAWGHLAFAYFDVT